MKRKFIRQPILASWKDAYRQMEEVFDPLWNDEVVYYETHEPPYGRGPAMQAVYELYRKHKGEADWDEAYARFTASGTSGYNEAIMSSSVFGQDAGMILDTFRDVIDEIEIPEGYNWDYKIDQLENGEPAGQFFIMTDDDQPVAFFTFALTKDGESLDIVNDRKLYTKLVNELKSEVRKLDDMSEFVGKPKQETIVIASTIADVDMPDTVDQRKLKDRMLYTCIAMKNAAEDVVQQAAVADIDEVSYKLSNVRRYVDQLEDMLQTWHTTF